MQFILVRIREREEIGCQACDFEISEEECLDKVCEELAKIPGSRYVAHVITHRVGHAGKMVKLTKINGYDTTYDCNENVYLRQVYLKIYYEVWGLTLCLN